MNTQREQGHYYLVHVYDMVTLGIADDDSSDENSILVSLIHALPFFSPENSHAISESLTGYLIHNNQLIYLLVISDTNRKFCRNKCVDINIESIWVYSHPAYNLIILNQFFVNWILS